MRKAIVLWIARSLRVNVDLLVICDDCIHWYGAKLDGKKMCGLSDISDLFCADGEDCNNMLYTSKVFGCIEGRNR